MARNEPISILAGKKVCAFCGIANPDSFKKALLAAGAQVLSFDIFPDHHRYSKNELEKIKARFIDCRADFLISTQKDGMRLQKFPEFLKIIYMLSIELEIIPSRESIQKIYIGTARGGVKNNLTTRIPAVKERLIINSLRHVPVSLRRSFAVFIARLFFHLSLKHRLIAIHNLIRSFPDKSLKEIISWRKNHMQALLLLLPIFLIFRI